MQFANASAQLMAPWANVHHVICASELFQSKFGRALLSEMHEHPQLCIDAYNTGVKQHPDGQTPQLNDGELPVWTVEGELQPRAMLLTLLARLVACDLFVHGRGGMKYDQAMEHWCASWLHCSPCRAVMATATLRLQTGRTTVTDARRIYSTPPFDVKTKTKYLNAIEHAPYKSKQRQSQFQNMHRWLNSIQPPLDIVGLQKDKEIAQRRDWAFPLYPTQQLDQLFVDINAM